MATSFYNIFPKVKYNINGVKPEVTEDVTNIFFRIGFIKSLLTNISSYSVYDIEDGDTPEIVAEKMYNDAGAAWMILMANNIADPQFEWPLDYKSFQQYIIEKYGSVEIAKTQIHHYEKVITRTNTRTNETSETRFVINGKRLTDNMLSDNVSFSYYYPWSVTTFRTADTESYKSDLEDPVMYADLDDAEPFNATQDRGNLAITGEYEPPSNYLVGDDTIDVVVKGEVIYCYDYE
ncbi:hypothetical protein EB001_26135, partial [bacterium]|nr:hypothetical protein [bacterium]